MQYSKKDSLCSSSVWFTELSESIIVGDRPRPKPKENEKENNTYKTHTHVHKALATEVYNRIWSESKEQQQHRYTKIWVTRWRWFVSFIEFFQSQQQQQPRYCCYRHFSLLWKSTFPSTTYWIHCFLHLFSVRFVYIAIFCLFVGWSPACCCYFSSPKHCLAFILSMWLVRFISIFLLFNLCAYFGFSFEKALASTANVFDMQAFATGLSFLDLFRIQF